MRVNNKIPQWWTAAFNPKKYLIKSKYELSGSATSVFVKNIIFNNRFSMTATKIWLQLFSRLSFIWVKVFKNGPSKICGRQPLKNLKWYGMLRHITSNFWQSLLRSQPIQLKKPTCIYNQLTTRKCYLT